MASLKIVVNHMRNDYNPMLKLKTLIPVFMKPQCGFRYSMFGNPSFKAIVEHPNEVYPLLKLDIAMKNAEKQIRITEPHWRFCYSILHKVSTMSVLLVQQLDSSECRDAACILYLFFRALDTVEDDTTIPDEVKIPILKDFHRHIYDRDFRITCGTKERRVLMDNLHQVSTAFLELNESYQEAIENIIMRMGAGMAKFMDKEIETLEEYDEYCYIVGPLTILGFSKLFHASGTEILLTDSFSLSSGFLPLKIDVIKDFLEDINETPKSRCHWPREIWSKYTNNLEDLKYEENSEKAIQCLNDMVTNSLLHIDGAFEYLTQLRDPGAFRFFAILEVISIGEIALCYNNIQVFRGPMILRPGLMAQIFDRTRTMSDVYGAFYEFCSILKSKVNMSDPNAKTTISRIEAVQKTCRDSGTLDKWKPYVFESQPSNNRGLIAFFIITVAVFYAYLSPNYRPNQIKTMWPASASSVENVGNK